MLTMSLVTPGQGHFWPKGHNLNKHGRGLLGDATYQISRLYALWFQTRRFVHAFPHKAYVNNATPGARLVLAPGALFEQTW